MLYSITLVLGSGFMVTQWRFSGTILGLRIHGWGRNLSIVLYGFTWIHAAHVVMGIILVINNSAGCFKPAAEKYENRVVTQRVLAFSRRHMVHHVCWAFCFIRLIMKIRNFVFLISVVFLASSCTKKIPQTKDFAGGVTASATDLNKGKKVYTEYCMACHGVNGDGKGPRTKDFSTASRFYFRYL